MSKDELPINKLGYYIGIGVSTTFIMTGAFLIDEDSVQKSV